MKDGRAGPINIDSKHYIVKPEIIFLALYPQSVSTVVPAYLNSSQLPDWQANQLVPSLNVRMDMPMGLMGLE